MNVLIVESPGKVKAINKYLGSNYKVLASFGHIRDLPSKDGSVEPDNDFAMSWEVDGKATKRVSEIAIHFNSAPYPVFGQNGEQCMPNLLILRIQPEEGISLKFLSKQPGAGMKLRPVSMDFNYGASFGERSPTAYETLLLDAILGDATLYSRQDMVEASWAAVQPIMEVWHNTKFDFPNYPAGTWGPKAADEMLARHGHAWRKP